MHTILGIGPEREMGQGQGQGQTGQGQMGPGPNGPVPKRAAPGRGPCAHEPWAKGTRAQTSPRNPKFVSSFSNFGESPATNNQLCLGIVRPYHEPIYPSPAYLSSVELLDAMIKFAVPWPDRRRMCAPGSARKCQRRLA